MQMSIALKVTSGMLRYVDMCHTLGNDGNGGTAVW